MNRIKRGFFQVALINEPISELGNIALDKVVFCWALMTLNPDIPEKNAHLSFERLSKAYNVAERFFHRGLGHSRQLIPSVAQRAYFVLISTQFDKENTGNKENNFIQLRSIFDAFIPETEKIYEAQGIIGAFYHEVVHRCDKTKELLKSFKKKNNAYYLDPLLVPLTSVLIDSKKTSDTQELCCLIAEWELSQLNIPNKLMVPIILAIYCTPPFCQNSHPDRLKQHLAKISHALQLNFSDEEEQKTLEVAIGVANRDVGAYGSDSLDEFNKKITAMMYEVNPKLLDEDHGLDEEASALHFFYSFHKDLLRGVNEESKCLFFDVDPMDQRTQTLNAHAKKLLELDTCLQALLLGSLQLSIFLAKYDKQTEEFINDYVDIADERNLSEIDAEIKAVLNLHGQKVTVNGLSFVRGSDSGRYAQEFVKIFGMKPLLEIANIYPDDPSTYIDTLINNSLSPSF